MSLLFYVQLQSLYHLNQIGVGVKLAASRQQLYIITLFHIQLQSWYCLNQIGVSVKIAAMGQKHNSNSTPLLCFMYSYNPGIIWTK